MGQSAGLRQLYAFEVGVVDVFCKVDFFLTVNLLFEVRHATVADLDCVAVKDYVEHMTFR